eukprot:1448769-Amphidinium_carterae.1
MCPRLSHWLLRSSRKRCQLQTTEQGGFDIIPTISVVDHLVDQSHLSKIPLTVMAVSDATSASDKNAKKNHRGNFNLEQPL